jgi:subtilisin family serine protease
MDRIKNPPVQVSVYDYAGNPIFKAEVTLQPKKNKTKRTLVLHFNKKVQVFYAKNVLPGSYVLKVEAAGFEPDKRDVSIAHATLKEIFILGRKGMPSLYRGKVRVPFEPQLDLLAAAIKPGVTKKEEEGLIQFAEKFKLKIERTGENIHKSNVRVFRFPARTSDKTKVKLQTGIAEHPLVQYVGPIVKIDEESLSFLTNNIIVKFKSDVVKDEVYSLAKEFNLTVLRHIPYAGNAFHLRYEGPASFKILDVCAALVKTNRVEYAEPDLYSTVVNDQLNPTDYLYPMQWHHALIRTPGAWQLLANLNPNDTFGNPNIIIAVVDSGVDVNNRDFSGTLTNGVPKVYQLFDFANMVANNNNRDPGAPYHGTGCAGAASGQANNSSPIPGQNEGIAGVAGNCRLMGIRYPSGTESQFSDAYIWLAGFDPNSTTLGFPAQISPGADVITNSYGAFSGHPISGIMSDTFDFLTTYGRGGKGILLFFSVGNGPVDYTLRRPWAAYEKTFAVSASTLANDGVTEVFATTYSGFGGAAIVDLCAPSQDEYLGARAFHNPPQNYGAVTCDEFGRGNLPGHPAVQTTLSQTANAASFTTLTAGVALGTTTLNVVSNAGFAVNQWIRIGQHGDENAEWVSITAITGTMQLTVTACANSHSGGSPIFGTSTLSVVNNTGFVAGRWLLLGQPNQLNAEACLIRQVSGTTQIVIAGPLHNHGVNTPVITGPNDYRNSFGGTSFSTPVCAGVAALMLSANPELNWVRVRNILRMTATHIDAANIDPIGQWVDTDGDGVADYSRWYGYGRVNAEAAVQEAINLIGVGALADIDTWILENSTDVGDVPCPPPYSPDVWVRNLDPAVDDPAHITEHQEPIRGQDNWIHLNVRNRGTLDSQDVYVRIFITRWAGTQYVYPDDFIPTNPPGTSPTPPLAPGTYLIDEIHISSIPAGSTVNVHTVWPANLIPPASVTINGITYSWADACLLVDVSPHDGPTPTGNNTWDNNNLCQKNVFPVDPGDSDNLAIAFVVGHYTKAADLLNLRIVRRKLPIDVTLYFDYIFKDVAKRAQRLFDPAQDKNVLTTCNMTILSETNAELLCQKNKTISHVVIMPQTKFTLPCCHPTATTKKYQLYPARKDKPTVFTLPFAQTSFIPMPREKGEYQVVALRLKGLKRLPKGQYHVDIYQEDLDGKLEGGINFVIEKK